MLHPEKRRVAARIFLSTMSLLLVATGALSILRGEWSYLNYWGGLVLAPLGILFGLLLLYATIFKWKQLK
jgi:hypothetical protein